MNALKAADSDEGPKTVSGGAKEREEDARLLRGEAEHLKPKARLEDLSVYTVEKMKPTAKGEARTYKY